MDCYHYRVVVYTHSQHTFIFKQHVKVNFASDDPFKLKVCFGFYMYARLYVSVEHLLMHHIKMEYTLKDCVFHCATTQMYM